MVFVSERRAEQGHEPVAGKLRRRTPIPAHLGEARVEKCVDEIAHPLGSEAFGERGGVDDVAKENGDLLHFTGKRAHRSRDLGLWDIGLRCGRTLEARRVERGAALPAEFVLGRVGSAA